MEGGMQIRNQQKWAKYVVTFEYKGFQVLQGRNSAQCGNDKILIATQPQEFHLHDFFPSFLKQLKEPMTAIHIDIKVEPVASQAGISKCISPQNTLPQRVPKLLWLCHLLLLHCCGLCMFWLASHTSAGGTTKNTEGWKWDAGSGKKWGKKEDKLLRSCPIYLKKEPRLNLNPRHHTHQRWVPW